MHVLERERLLVKRRRLRRSVPLPRRHVGEVVVIAAGFAFGASALGLGFRHVESGPLVRSSYHAWTHVT